MRCLKTDRVMRTHASTMLGRPKNKKTGRSLATAAREGLSLYIFIILLILVGTRTSTNEIGILKLAVVDVESCAYHPRNSGLQIDRSGNY